MRRGAFGARGASTLCIEDRRRDGRAGYDSSSVLEEGARRDDDSSGEHGLFFTVPIDALSIFCSGRCSSGRGRAEGLPVLEALGD